MASVTKRKRVKADGSNGDKWVVRWKDATGAYPQKTFDTKKAADRHRAFVEVEIHEGKGVSVPASYTVGDLCRDFLKSSHGMQLEGKLARSTHTKEGFYFRRHIVPALGSVPLRDLSETHVDKWLTGLRGGKLRGSGPLKPSTIKQLTQALGRALDMAQRRKLIADNLARKVGAWREHRAGRNEPIRTFTVAEARILLASIQHRQLGLTAQGNDRARPQWTRRSEAFVRCTVYLAAFCGLRLGEVLALTWEQIDFTGSTIRVRHSLDAFDTIKAPKTKAGNRDVPMPKMLVDELEAWRPHVAPEPRGLIFRTKSGAKLTTASFHRHYWQRALEDAGLGPDAKGRRFHYHALRHFAASMMIAGRVPMPDVARILGHASFDVTLQVYAHPVLDGTQQHAAIEAMTVALRTIDDAQTHTASQAIEFAD